jgi:hypothetical protein
MKEYEVISYWIGGVSGEIIKKNTYKSVSEAEYRNKENALNSECTYTEIKFINTATLTLAKPDCSYCN